MKEFFKIWTIDKIYNLTSKGVDLYPMLIEMALWSKKHLNVEFSHIAIDLFEEIDSIGIENHISNTINYYNSKITEL